MAKTIKDILDEIASESSTNKKMEILLSYKNGEHGELLKQVLYLANSKRIKFYIKQIPEYPVCRGEIGLDSALKGLSELYTRKSTGHSAIGYLSHLLSSLTTWDANVVEKIILKDLRINMAANNINKIYKNLIEQTPYMGAKAHDSKLVEKLFEGGRKVVSQKKMDGRYAFSIIRSGEVELESRQGEKNYVEDSTFFKELSNFKDCVLNGELVMGKNIPRYESNGIIASLISINKKKSEGKNILKELKKFENKHMSYQEAMDAIKFVVWDTITPEEHFEGKSSTPYYQRLENLSKLISDSNSTMVEMIDGKIVNSTEEAMEHFTEMLKQNEEGTIIKTYDGPWKDSKPNTQVKLKKEINLDLKIVGFKYGTGKNVKLISSIHVESSDGLLKTSPTGMTEETMEMVTEKQSELLGKILEIKCSGISHDSDKNYSVYHPVFKMIRDDKNVANSLQECIEIDKASTFL